MNRLVSMALFGSLAIAIPFSSAHSAQINTGSAEGAYHSDFCPNLVKQLEDAGSPSECLESEGSGENLRRVSRNPNEFGFAQMDVFALEAERYGGAGAFQVVRADDAQECVFAVTRNRRYSSYGEIAVNADRLKFFIPGKGSGSALTFRYLQKLDGDLKKAVSVTNVGSASEAVERALSDDNAVAFFVQFPDPGNALFKTIRGLKGHIVPVVDRILLGERVDDRPVYFVQSTPIAQSKWVSLNLGKRVVTACTPLVLFTGATARISGGERRTAHRQLVLKIKGMESKDLVPETSRIARIIQGTRTLRDETLFHFQELSLNARERALPFLTRLYRGAGHFVEVMIVKARPPGYRESRDRERSDRY